MSAQELAALALSPNWDDRVRAEVLRKTLRVTLPDQFPCIYEPPESPRQSGWQGKPYVWVKSPDMDMLTELLPLYQELWDSYTAQWGADSRRLMVVGRLDGLEAANVYPEGTEPKKVIGDTLFTHREMLRTAPAHLRAMYPQYDWKTSRRIDA